MRAPSMLAQKDVHSAALCTSAQRWTEPSPLKRQQALKERAVTTQSDAQILRGNLVRASRVCLTFEFDARTGECFLQALHDLGNELVPFPDSLRRVIDKTALHGIPARAKTLSHIRDEEWGELLTFILHFGGLVYDHRFFEISSMFWLLSRYLCPRSQVFCGETSFLQLYGLHLHWRWQRDFNLAFLDLKQFVEKGAVVHDCCA